MEKREDISVGDFRRSIYKLVTSKLTDGRDSYSFSYIYKYQKETKLPIIIRVLFKRENNLLVYITKHFIDIDKKEIQEVPIIIDSLEREYSADSNNELVYRVDDIKEFMKKLIFLLPIKKKYIVCSFDICFNVINKRYKNKNTNYRLRKVFGYYLSKRIPYSIFNYTEGISFDIKMTLLELLIKKNILNMFVFIIMDYNPSYPPELQLDEDTLETKYKIDVQKYYKDEQAPTSDSEPEDNSE